jgi:hypothetical protein
MEEEEVGKQKDEEVILSLSALHVYLRLYLI